MTDFWKQRTGAMQKYGTRYARSPLTSQKMYAEIGYGKLMFDLVFFVDIQLVKF